MRGSLRRLTVVISGILFVTTSIMAQTAPPTLSFSTPPGAPRGATVTLTIDGTNLTDADALLFSDPGLSGKITSVVEIPKEKRVAVPGVDTGAVIEDPSKKNKVTADIAIAETVAPG